MTFLRLNMSIRRIAYTLGVLLHLTEALKCYTCVNGKRESDCNWRVRECEVDQDMCYTEIRNSGNGISITKSCYQRQACSTLASQNTHECPRVCWLCCVGDHCNKKGPPQCRCNLVSVSGLAKPTTTKRPFFSRRTRPRTRRTTTTKAPTTTTTVTTQTTTKKATTTTKATTTKATAITTRATTTTSTAPTTTTTTTTVAVTTRPKTCEESTFLPIPETSGLVTCDDIDQVESNICEFTPTLGSSHAEQQHYYVSLSDTDTSVAVFHQCQFSMGVQYDGDLKPEDVISTIGLDLICINMSMSSIEDVPYGFENSTSLKKSMHSRRVSTQGSKTLIECVSDNLSILSRFNTSMFNFHGSSPPEYSYGEELMSNFQSLEEIAGVCDDRVFGVRCQMYIPEMTTEEITTRMLTTSLESTTTITTEKVAVENRTSSNATLEKYAEPRVASVPEWSIAVIAIVCVSLLVIAVVISLRKCGKKGFYRVWKRKVSPKHNVTA